MTFGTAPWFAINYKVIKVLKHLLFRYRTTERSKYEVMTSTISKKKIYFEFYF